MGLFRDIRVWRLKRRVVDLEAARQKAEARYDELSEAHYEMKIEMAMRIIEDRAPPKKDLTKIAIWNDQGAS